MSGKYTYKPYSSIFPDLFKREKERILSRIKNTLTIEHVGSTAVPGLGGKGIIDIAIAVSKDELNDVSDQLQILGYEFKPGFSTKDRLYFVIYLPDPEEETRRYHIHLTYPDSKEWIELIYFRDYLKDHPEAAKEYSELKEKAASASHQDGKIYRSMKEPFFRKITPPNHDMPRQI